MQEGSDRRNTRKRCVSSSARRDRTEQTSQVATANAPARRGRTQDVDPMIGTGTFNAPDVDVAEHTEDAYIPGAHWEDEPYSDSDDSSSDVPVPVPARRDTGGRFARGGSSSGKMNYF